MAYDRDEKAVAALANEGATGASSLGELSSVLPSPRFFWLMLPAGKITDDVMRGVAAVASPGDIVIDGGNSFWKHDIERAAFLKERDLHFVDVGVSGGVWGLERGYCMMIGGAPEQVALLDPIFAALAPESATSRVPNALPPRANGRPSKAMSIAVRRARAISPRWSTTASNTE